ncbi:BTB/POZ domain-containing protein FBL11 isoform X7 [Dendrobium catenatum]|uniref:BTB/POZ domain-containing protein FBL11 isoform X7 n=1 Tax=Dendrobium catenatum TaxID=906689 RepID=UPI0009F6663C|nr:BTB/POZ domain-containing protein FBL11 isoform X7 [Dendrobium catenatum]
MASTSNKLEDIVVLELVDPSVVTEKLSEEEITISTSSIHNWDIPSIVCHRIVKVQADRSRLSEKSCYFHSLLSGNFSESRLYHISIHWSMESILNVLQFIYGYQLIVTSTNFLNLLEAALFFGVDSLLLDCEAWFQKFTSGFGLCRHQISLASIIEISNFSLDHGITSIMGTCKDYIARNFAWAASSSSFVDIPYTLLYSAIEHPELTVESEAQLCEALLGWLSHNIEFRECFPINYEDSFYNILKKVRICLLPLDFATGCTLVTDMGISKLLMKCPRLQSLISSYTAFGRNSIKILCLEKKFRNGSDGTPGNSSAMASRLQELQIDGCKDVDNNSLLHLMSKISIMRVLSLRETSLDDDALYKLASCSLEKLDISDTLVSMQSLNYVIKRNPEMRSLRGTGCSKLHHGGDQNLAYTHRTEFQDFLDELGKRCMLEELALGWGFSSIGLERLQPAFRNLRILYVGLGAEMDHHLLCLVPKICPLLESLVLRFQVIYDDIVRSILESLKHLQMLWLCCCLGYFTSLSFQIPMLNLTSLKLDWVTPWMTNNDLILLTQNCSNVLELSLSGCKLLDSGSQEIIASGWPGLKYVHLEECGRITSQGVTFLYNCKAIEELKLRHNGRGLARNFMLDAASKLPLLRRLSLDLCDAVQGGFDSPSHSERFYLSTVKICRCKAQRCAFKLEKLGGFNPEHKETIVLEYTSKQLRTTVVRERI